MTCTAPSPDALPLLWPPAWADIAAGEGWRLTNEQPAKGPQVYFTCNETRARCSGAVPSALDDDTPDIPTWTTSYDVLLFWLILNTALGSKLHRIAMIYEITSIPKAMLALQGKIEGRRW